MVDPTLENSAEPAADSQCSVRLGHLGSIQGGAIAVRMSRRPVPHILRRPSSESVTLKSAESTEPLSYCNPSSLACDNRASSSVTQQPDRVHVSRVLQQRRAGIKPVLSSQYRLRIAKVFPSTAWSWQYELPEYHSSLLHDMHEHGELVQQNR
ncbi:hypothetical protein BDN70DRAFT_887486 [Pholiota conissans]|uniref:Uncharacterized protein n=1 Tax=Pholiota conissans TaxID=109636 RepID=A0A9P5YNT8_9AGAR|nr:hypothetical protein BDN70DRAFT_887486 [Pholiota conissans]